MAEAHSAVAFSFIVSHDGFDVNVNYKALYRVWQSGVRSWKKRVARWKNGLRNGIYPTKPGSLMTIISIILAASVIGYDVNEFYGVAALRRFSFRLVSPPHDLYAAVVLFSLFIWVAGIFLHRYTLLLLLTYTAWMYEPRGRMSIRTKIWIACTKLFSGRNPGLFSFQLSLPRLPVPQVEDTMRRYLRSVRPFMEDEQYERMTRLADDFQNTIAKRLQRYLVAKSWWAANYVSDWWEDYVYLHGRAPLMVNSNYYGIDAIFLHPTQVQAARAANITFGMLNYMRKLDREKMAPIFLNNTVPLCSAQYERQFMTTRIPGIEKDKVIRYRDGVHLAVLHRGAWYKVYFYFGGTYLQACELQQQFQQIIDDAATPIPGEDRLAALTAGERIPWAQARRRFFRYGINHSSLDCIEKAAFVVVLDEDEQNYVKNDTASLNSFARCMLHGKGNDRWYDKSFNLIVCKNGRVGFNAEHSWADAPIMAAMWEVALFEHDVPTGYDKNGNCRGTVRDLTPKPVRLQWEFDKECISIMDQQWSVAKNLLADVDLHLLVHSAYGKGFIKTVKCSPDAYIQLALQLAYFRDAGKFCLTYEASMTRLFREGRTETVRSCTNESVAFCRAMENPSATNEERLALFVQATEYHQDLYRKAMTGKGVDRHLFCLYVISKYLGLDSPFLKEVLSEPWRLSTSQTPHGQISLDLVKNPDFICAGGGFGPVADDGYGVSYIIAGEDLIFFHISSKNNCPATNSKQFADRIEQALKDMRQLTTKKKSAAS